MNCEKARTLLSNYYDGELPSSSAEELETHLAACKLCAAELNNFEAISGMLKSNYGPKLATPPSWEQFTTRLETSRLENSDPTPATKANSNFRRMFAFVAGTIALAASILLFLSLNTRTASDSVAQSHKHSLTNDATIAIDFEKLLDGNPSQPIAALNSLSQTYEGREAGIDESETELGYKPSITQALTGGAKLVSNQILKLPQCNCPAGACNCGPTGCNCAASLCKRIDGTEFLVVEHCATQNVSFGHLKSDVLHDQKCDIQWINAGKQLIASWVTDHRRLTVIGLNDKAEALAIVASLASL